MEKDYIIMDITCGDLVGSVYDTREEAEEWIKCRDVPEKYEVIERY